MNKINGEYLKRTFLGFLAPADYGNIQYNFIVSSLLADCIKILKLYRFLQIEFVFLGKGLILNNF